MTKQSFIILVSLIFFQSLAIPNLNAQVSPEELLQTKETLPTGYNNSTLVVSVDNIDLELQTVRGADKHPRGC